MRHRRFTRTLSMTMNSPNRKPRHASLASVTSHQSPVAVWSGLTSHIIIKVARVASAMVSVLTVGTAGFSELTGRAGPELASSQTFSSPSRKVRNSSRSADDERCRAHCNLQDSGSLSLATGRRRLEKDSVPTPIASRVRTCAVRWSANDRMAAILSDTDGMLSSCLMISSLTRSDLQNLDLTVPTVDE